MRKTPNQRDSAKHDEDHRRSKAPLRLKPATGIGKRNADVTGPTHRFRANLTEF
jgi:hypothetical protein